MDLNLFTPTTSHPPSWCLIHVSHYGTANGGPRSSSFKIHTEVAVVFSSRRFRHHAAHRYNQEARPSSRPRCLPFTRSASAQGVCLSPRLSRAAVALVSGGNTCFAPWFPHCVNSPYAARLFLVVSNAAWAIPFRTQLESAEWFQSRVPTL